MQHLEEQAAAEGPIASRTNDYSALGALNRAMAAGETLAESGDYAAAGKLLSRLLTPYIQSDMRDMLVMRIEILKQWAVAGKVDLSSYRRFYLLPGSDWFHLRTKPIVSLWSMTYLPEAGRLALMADLLEKRLALHPSREERQGLLVIIQRIPHVEKVEPGEAASAYLRAGNLQHDLRDWDGAEQSWKNATQVVGG